MPPSWNVDTDFAAGTTTPLSVARLNNDFGANGNIMYLFNRASFAIVYNKGSDFTGTNTPAYADVDAVNLNAVVTVYSTRFLVVAYMLALSSANLTQLDITANGVRCNSGNVNGLAGPGVAATAQLVTFLAPFTGLTPGSITFRLQARISAAGTWTIKGTASPIVMFGLEW